MRVAGSVIDGEVNVASTMFHSLSNCQRTCKEETEKKITNDAIIIYRRVIMILARFVILFVKSEVDLPISTSDRHRLAHALVRLPTEKKFP